ncbi:MvdC/MvdD family ATP grasp protein [Xanthomonas citri]|uniref:MvdC/MvdD family ATP grasp protein n=1 Tax=Xanthomonas citri TaxID=346 RepID=UPI0031F30B31
MRDTYKKAVLINSLDGDFHAAVFGQALSRRGSRVIRWNAEDYPTKSSVSISYAERHADVKISTGEHNFDEDDIGVVWTGVGVCRKFRKSSTSGIVSSSRWSWMRRSMRTSRSLERRSGLIRVLAQTPVS